MEQYKDLIRQILQKGRKAPTRAKLKSTGQNIDALTIFGHQSRYDLKEFPLLTLKKIHWPSVVHELIWFLRGEENIKYLKDNNISIWDEWADYRGIVHFSYPLLWRRWPRNGQFDQVKHLIKNIKIVKENPTDDYGRRLIISAWEPYYSNSNWSSLPACHTMSQYHIEDGKLSCQLYQRSADVFLGVPFNIASYALFTYILAFYTGLQVGEFIHTLGNAHIYLNHVEQCEEMLGKEILPPPTVRLNERILSYDDLDKLKFEDIELVDYRSHGKLTGEVAV